MGEVVAVHGSVPWHDMDRPPDVLTVEEAARVLRISRGLAFQEAARYRATGGREGIPNYRIGRCLRVPKAELVRSFGLEGSRVSPLAEAPAPAGAVRRPRRRAE